MQTNLYSIDSLWGIALSHGWSIQHSLHWEHQIIFPFSSIRQWNVVLNRKWTHFAVLFLHCQSTEEYRHHHHCIYHTKASDDVGLFIMSLFPLNCNKMEMSYILQYLVLKCITVWNCSNSFFMKWQFYGSHCFGLCQELNRMRCTLLVQ